MERFFEWFLQSTWQASVIAAMILVAQFFLRKRLSPAWRYGLWMLLVARLLIPVPPSSAISIFNFVKWPLNSSLAVASESLPVEPSRTLIQAAPQPPSSQIATPMAPKSEVNIVTETRVSKPLPQLPEAMVSGASIQLWNWEHIAISVWLLGVVVLLARFFWGDICFRRRLAHHLPLSNVSVLKLMEQCADSVGVSRHPTLIETDEVDSPAVYGLWRKSLLLPDGLCEQLSESELRHILLHELAHIKRRDPEMNWLLAILQILHWFNPMLWYAFLRMRSDRELATDDLALAHTEPSDRSMYGETILKLLDRITQRPTLPSLIGIAESKEQIKERICAIAHGVGPRWQWAALAVAVIIGSVALTSAEQQSKSVNLLERYPTTLTKGDSDSANARPWEFTKSDIYQVSRFTLDVGKQFHIEMGVSDLGVGHCKDGSVWAVLIPREKGKITSSAAATAEDIAHLWLRFHPGKINVLIPPETVATSEAGNLEERIRSIAEVKMQSSWHANGDAMIPEPKDMTVDADTKNGPRRFFVVDTEAQSVEYVDAFVEQGIKTKEAPKEQATTDADRPSVVSVTPSNGAQNVDPSQGLHIRFDRPMSPSQMKLEWVTGGFRLNGSIQPDPDQKGVVIPVLLMSGVKQNLVINRGDYRGIRESSQQKFPMEKDGFVDAKGIPANEYNWNFQVKGHSAKPGATKPKVVSYFPQPGATTALMTYVKLTFDQPMMRPESIFPYLKKTSSLDGPYIIDNIDYDPATYTFTFPVLLRVNDDVRLTIRGFYSVDGAECDPIILHYQTDNEKLDPNFEKQATVSAHNPDMQKLLIGMKEARMRLHSGVETVLTYDLIQSTNGFDRITANTATFKWQGSNQVYADITGPMTSPKKFILGCDSKNFWLYSEDDEGQKRLDQTPIAMTRSQINLLDPFGLVNYTVQKVVSNGKIVYLGKSILDKRSCQRLQQWNVNTKGSVWASLTEWWIDCETMLPTQIVQYHSFGCRVVRFDYKDLNKPLPDSDFTPPSAENAKALFFTKEPQANDGRFFQIKDGSSGVMSGRIGFRSEKGTTSSGLN